MKFKNIMSLFALLMIAGIVFATPVQVAFKDLSTVTLAVVHEEDPTYPIGTSIPVDRQWLIQTYVTYDSAIDPLDENGLPTGDDLAITGQVNSSFGLKFLNNGYWGSSATTFNDPGGAGSAFQGDKVYCRIFNSTSIATATKYIVMTSLYTVLTTTPQSVQVTPAYGWSPWTWISPPPTGYSLTINSNWEGADIYCDGVATGHQTPYTWVAPGDVAPVGLYSLQMDNVVWTPVAHPWDNLADETVTFIGIKTPGMIQNPNPEDGHEYHLAWDEDTRTYPLSWEAPEDPAPSGYMLYWMEEAAIDLGNAFTWTTPVLEPGLYTWKVVPYITDPVMITKGTSRSQAPLQARIQTPAGKGEGTGALLSFTVIRDPAPEIVIDNDGTITGGTGSASEDLPADMPGTNTGLDTVIYTITATGTNRNVTVYRPAAWGLIPWYCWLYVGTNVYAGTNPIPADQESFTFTGVNFDAKGDGTVVIDDDLSLTLPVELSSFTATLTAQRFVKLTWVSQSETEMLGYRVYRGKDAEQASAIMITPSMIPATNTSTTQTYSITDNEVEIGVTYWYWLESVDYGTSFFHGPVSIIVEGEVPPVLPEVTMMKNAYPNPFKSSKSTTIEVAIKAGEKGSVTIYNILGQVVKTYTVTEGNHKINWNGRDAKGNVCGNGIYFYKLNTPSVNQTKKMVIMK